MPLLCFEMLLGDVYLSPAALLRSYLPYVLCQKKIFIDLWKK